MDSPVDESFRRRPRLTPCRGAPAARRPPPSFRAPHTCEELRTYIQNVRLLKRVRDVDWVTLQPLLDLTEADEWQWRPDVQFPLLSRLFRLSGTVFTPEGLCVYPHVLETRPVNVKATL